MKNLINKVFVFFGGNIPEVTEKEVCAVKDFLKNSFTVLKKYQDSREDDKTTALEWAGILKSALPILGNIKNWKGIRDRVLSFKYEDGKDLVEFVVSQGVLPDKAELVVIHLVEYVEIQIDAYNKHAKPIIEAFKK
jgi:hypothetical protein